MRTFFNPKHLKNKNKQMTMKLEGNKQRGDKHLPPKYSLDPPEIC